MSATERPVTEDPTPACEQIWWRHWVDGPRRTRWETLPPQVGDQAPEADLIDEAGNPARLTDAWSGGPALVLFWRHFGCGCGLDRAARLRDETSAYQGAGANVVIVGQGDPERARAYSSKYQLPVPVLVDADESAYRAYGLLEGTESQVLFDAPDDFLGRGEAAGRGFVEQRRAMDRPLVDNPWLLPGEFVVGADGVIRHAHRYQHCEDFPDPRVHVAAIRESTGAFGR